MRRRDFTTAIGVAMMSSLAAHAQSRPVRRLGILLYTDPKSDPQMAPLLQGLHDLGYIDGRNVLLEYRSANGKPESNRSRAPRHDCCGSAPCRNARTAPRSGVSDPALCRRRDCGRRPTGCRYDAAAARG